MQPNWQLLCRVNDGTGETHTNINFVLANGLTVSGRISYEDAKQLFREPRDLSPIDRNCATGEVVVVLPVSTVVQIQFPSDGK